MLWTTPILLHLTQNNLVFLTAVVFGSAAVSVIELTGSATSNIPSFNGDFNDDFSFDFNL